MKIYLVGGAVRDQLLGLPVKEKDWVVVGATVEDMLQRGFRQVGKDFPVFLHPETHEEYALARKERKVGPGYTGFTFDASPDVSLEDDLKRRDLTVNAMAEVDGVLIDPYHGKEDLANKILRHVSPAFVEDPVRILRVARFAARFNFQVAPETIELMKKMVAAGEVNALVAERVWKELERALLEPHSEKFFEILAECGALDVLFPKINLQETGIHALLVVAKKSHDSAIRFAALMCAASVDAIKEVCDRYRVPTAHRELALLTVNCALNSMNIDQLQAEEVLQFLLSADAFRREERFKKLLTVLEARMSSSFSSQLIGCYNAAKKIDTKELIATGVQGKALAEQLNLKRLDAIKKVLAKGFA